MNANYRGLGIVIDGITFLSPIQALPLLQQDAILVDLRNDNYKNGRVFAVGKTISICYKELANEYSCLPKDKMLILADYVGIHSKEAVKFLLDKGYTKVASLTGGIVEWVNEDMPTNIDHDEELVGGCACQLKKRKRIKV